MSGVTDCSPGLMTRCTDPLASLTDNKDLGWGSSKQELLAICPKLMDGLICINTFTGIIIISYPYISLDSCSEVSGQ